MPDGKSLNSHFLTGKNNLPLIPTLLMRFRTHMFAGVTDVSSMFNRFLLQESDTEYLRFVFAMKKPNSKEDKVELINFRNRCLPFGIFPSPSIATYLLKKHATKFLNTPLHLAARFVMESTYMDDCSWGANTLEEMKQLVKDIKHIHCWTGILVQQGFGSNILNFDQLPFLSPLRYKKVTHLFRKPKAIAIECQPKIG